MNPSPPLTPALPACVMYHHQELEFACAARSLLSMQVLPQQALEPVCRAAAEIAAARPEAARTLYPPPQALERIMIRLAAGSRATDESGNSGEGGGGGDKAARAAFLALLSADPGWTQWGCADRRHSDSGVDGSIAATGRLVRWACRQAARTLRQGCAGEATCAAEGRREQGVAAAAQTGRWLYQTIIGGAGKQQPQSSGGGGWMSELIPCLAELGTAAAPFHEAYATLYWVAAAMRSLPVTPAAGGQPPSAEAIAGLEGLPAPGAILSEHEELQPTNAMACQIALALAFDRLGGGAGAGPLAALCS